MNNELREQIERDLSDTFWTIVDSSAGPEELLRQLSAMYPHYDIEALGNDHILIMGDEEVCRRAALKQVDKMYVIETNPKYLSQIVSFLCKTRPDHTYKISSEGSIAVDLQIK